MGKSADQMELIFQKAQQEANESGKEIGVWKVTQDVHDAERMVYVIAHVNPWSSFGRGRKAFFVDSVYPSKQPAGLDAGDNQKGTA